MDNVFLFACVAICYTLSIPLAARPPQDAGGFPCSCVRIGSRLFS